MNSARSAHPRNRLARHRPLLMRSAMTVTAAALALTLSACQDTTTPVAGGTTLSSSPDETATTAPAGSTPNPTTSVDATALIGRTTITSDQAAMCGLDDATTAPADDSGTDSAGGVATDGSVDGTVDGTDGGTDDATTEPAAGEAPSASWLMAGGLLVEQCRDDELIGLSALSGEQIWAYSGLVGDGESDSSGDINDDTPSDTVRDTVAVGSRHLFVVRTTEKPASGLNDTSYTRELVALNPLTGNPVWTKPLDNTPEAGDLAQDPNPEVTVVESGGPGTGLTPTVAIHATGWSGFNADTGDPLWTITDDFQKLDDAEDGFSGATYVGDGVVLTESQSGTPRIVHGVDAKTGKVLWKTELPNDGVDGDWALNGHTVSQVSARGVNSINIINGKAAPPYRFPAEWLSTVATSQYAVALSGSDLVMTTVQNVRSPIWSIKVGVSVRPLAISADTVVVDAESGVQILDGRTGKVRTDVPTPEAGFGGDNTVIVDGLVKMSDGSIFEMSPPTGSVQ